MSQIEIQETIIQKMQINKIKVIKLQFFVVLQYKEILKKPTKPLKQKWKT